MEPPLPPLVHERSFRFLGAYAVAMGVVQVLVIVTGLFHVVMTQPLAILVAAAAVAAGWRYAAWLRPAQRLPAAPRPRRMEIGLAVAVFSLVGLLYVLCWVVAIAKPDLSWDGNSYHVPVVHFWSRRGYVHWIDFDVDPGPAWRFFAQTAFNGYPKGAELLDFLFVRGFASSLPVNTNNLVYFPLGVAGIAVAGRALGASPVASWIAGAALGLVPTIVAQQMTCYVDSAFAEAVAALVGALVVAVPALVGGRLPWKVAPALACSIGLAAGAKGSGLAPALLALGFVVLAGAWAVRASAPGERGAAARRQLGFAAAVAGGAFAVAGYWYVRNWVHAGNPLVPVRVAVFGHEIFAGVPVKVTLSEDALTPAYMAHWPGWKRVATTWLQGGLGLDDLAHHTWLEWAGTEHHWPRSMRWYDARDGGLGYLWILLCLPAIALVAVAAWRRRSANPHGGPRLAVFVPMAVVVVVTFLVTPMNWWARYTLGLFALGLPCAAYLVDRAARAPRLAARVALGAWLAAAFGVATYEAADQFRYSGLQGGFVPLPWVVEYTPRGLLHALIWYREPTYFYPGITRMDFDVISSDEAVGMGTMAPDSGAWLGQLCMPPGLRDIVPISNDVASDPVKLRDVVARHHLRWIYWNAADPTPAALLALARDEDYYPGYWRTYEVAPPDPHARTGVHGK